VSTSSKRYRSPQDSARGVTLLGVVNGAVGFFLEWGQINGISIKGVELISLVCAEGPDSILDPFPSAGSVLLLLTLPLAVTLPAMVLVAERLKPTAGLPSLIYISSGLFGAFCLVYSAFVTKALAGLHGVGFAVCLMGFLLIAAGGLFRWVVGQGHASGETLSPGHRDPPDAAPESPDTAATSTHRSWSEVLVSMLVPPPIFVFPLPRRMKLGALPPLTLILIASNLACYLVFNHRADFHDRIISTLFFNTGDVRLTTLLSAQFMHYSLIHLTVNMFVLFIIGNELERAVGWPLFLGFYLLGGAMANLVVGIAFQGIAIRCAGASGSIAAVLGLMLVTMPGRRIRLWFFQVFTHRHLDLRAGVVLSLYLVFQTVMALRQSWGLLYCATGYWNHVGGMFYGIAAALPIRQLIRSRLTAVDVDLSGLRLPLAGAVLSLVAGIIDLAL